MHCQITPITEYDSITVFAFTIVTDITFGIFSLSIIITHFIWTPSTRYVPVGCCMSLISQSLLWIRKLFPRYTALQCAPLPFYPRHSDFEYFMRYRCQMYSLPVCIQLFEPIMICTGVSAFQLKAFPAHLVDPCRTLLEYSSRRQHQPQHHLPRSNYQDP
jgi:hypothetical protein